MKDVAPIVKQYLVAGLANKGRGDVPGAKNAFQLAIAEAKRLRDKHGEASALFHLGGISRRFDRDLPRARKEISRSLALFETLGAPFGIGYALIELGTLDYQEGKFDKALEKLGRALPVFMDQHHQTGRAMVWHQMGLIEKARQNYSASERLFNDSLLIFQANGDQNAVGQVLLSLSDVAVNHHQNLGAAKSLLDRALSIFEQLGSEFDIEKTRLCLSALQQLDRGEDPA